ncbi:DNA primase [Staphylococcus sp. SQ8-PEA]|uniref:DNA primase n=1 Tax=Staphylococcus marylandisciuri TaxID=2981529 RepID=A0ABT2QQX5_9STAP|nr:DNA primase [Staphylococcus marylandisciuri]MCU5746381.1 DNA primase [Staphylococcus marylandisciuri]
MRIDQSVINEIKEKTDILDVVSEYVKLEKRGRNYIGLCPFHDEKTPSFTVSEDKQICHCFGCKKGGNVFQFIQEIKDIPFQEAVKELGERVNIQVNVPTGSESSSHQIASDDLQMIEMHELMQSYYHYALLKTVEGEEALNYLKSRGFTEEIIEKRKIGFAPDHPQFCHDFLQKKGYDIELAYEAGLLARNEESFNYYDRFRNRIMFPLKNAQGRTVGYSGRTYTNQEPKYLNSPETPIFHKRRLLYNLDQARRSIRKSDEIYLLEGFMDVIKSDQAGLSPVVATMGTELSQEHSTVIRKLTNNVTLLYDGDEAGQNASLKTGQRLLEQGFNIFVIKLPNNMDPDDYIKTHGEEAFTQFVAREKKSFVTYKINLHKDEILHNDLAYEKYLKEITQDISYMSSSILRKKVLQEAAELFKVNSDSLNRSVNQYSRFEPSHDSDVRIAPDFGRLNKYERAEVSLLKHFTRDKDTFLNYQQKLEVEDFSNNYFKHIFDVLRNFYAENDVFKLSDVLQYVESDELKEAFMALDNYMLNDMPYEQELEDYINILLANKQDDSIDILKHRLQEASRLNDLELQKYYLEKIKKYYQNTKL